MMRAVNSLGFRLRWLMSGRSTTAAVLQTTLLQAGTIVANVATGVLTARLLAPTGRGELAAITLSPIFLSLFLTVGVPSSLIYNLKRFADDAPVLIGAALILSSVFGIVGITVAYFAVPYVLHQYSSDIVQAARFFLITVPPQLYLYVCASVFETRGEFWYSNGTRILAPLATLLCLCVLAAARQLNPVTAAASYLLPGVLIGARMLADVLLRYRPVFLPFQVTPYNYLASYGMKSAGIDLLKTVGLQIDQFLVVSFLSPAAMGLYAAALSLSRMLLLLQSSVVRVLIPRVSARPSAEVVAATSHAARVTFAAGTIPCVLLAFFSPFVLHLAYGNKFIEAGAITRVLAFEALFAGLSSTLSQAFLALGRPGTASLLQGAGLALSVPLMIVLIPHLGLLGAAIALLISTLFRYALVLLSFPWLLHQAAPGIFLTQEDIESVRRRFMRRHADPSSSAS